jgi:hypothetical protein
VLLLRDSLAAEWPANSASVPIRMPLGLRVGKLARQSR